MPSLLWWYMTRELLRAIALTTVVLVTVIAFGATIKPLASDNLLSVGQTAKYLGLVTVPMLQFALPFAAGFAATLVMHRFVADNEVSAMFAGGVSHRTLLAPVAGLGLIAGLIMLVLTQSIIPRFWGIMQRTVAADLIQLFQASIERGAPFVMDDLQIYADRMRVAEGPADTGADSRIELWRVAVAELDAEGRIATDLLARSAVIDVYRDGGDVYLNLIMVDPVASDRQTDRFVRSSSIASSTIHLPNRLKDDPVTMTRGEMLWHRDHPHEFGPIRERYRNLARSIHRVMSEAAVAEALRAAGRIDLISTPGSETRFILERTDDPARPYALTRYDGRFELWRAYATGYELLWTDEGTIRRDGFDLNLREALIEDIGAGGPATPRGSFTVPNLRLPDLDPAQWADLPPDELLATATTMSAQAPAIGDAVEGIHLARAGFLRDLRARLLERYALSMTAPLLLLLGATLAMARRGGLPLNIYLWAFLPSVVDLILISGGQDMVEEGHALGEVVLWLGNVLLLAMILVLYGRIRRN